MRKIGLIPFLLLGMVACNDGGSKTEETATDTAAAASTAMDTTHHAAEPAAEVAPVPEIPAGAKVFFKNLKNGQKIKSPFKVLMGVSGIALDSAGVIKPASGHHHILIDNGDSLALGTVVPKDSTHLHFGNAQKEAELKLTPGEHKLTLQYADGIHRSYGGKLASSVTVTVQ
ncbi:MULTISPECIES: DUF4399 domain-containing protein [Niastella]|uniref:DUF4399 domain-containing protein n=1 Tax=Niastella soli TaxID=2821487 RepID=A0ABS3YML5_9BACT|nr:DUF4399 domain-containing protein [Niastella soli]MBO9199113.1 DUF4399 domain-containing protein [Niastella soli]